MFGAGDPCADLMIIGEAPGDKEDRFGEPFVGAAGNMLTKMIENVLLIPRSSVYVCNALKCRPPENRDPMPHEIEACRPFLMDQIRVVAPRIILLMGSHAVRAALEIPDGVTRARGRSYVLDGIETYVTYHPAHVLYQPSDKLKVFEDLCQVRDRLPNKVDI